jgi:DNA-directed RNA polymerase sigma subunit (sigma70/sigma32)
VLLRRYGLRGGRVQSHAAIAAWLGVSEERTRQLERDALHRLREIGGGSLLAA